jgi:Holliday junction resolvase RusA-like endonuclease
MNKKKFKEYIEKYGDVPNDYSERLAYLIETNKIKNNHLDEIRKAIKKLKGVRWNTIKFIFYFIPEATPRARINTFTKVFYVKNANDYSTIFKEFMESCIDMHHLITTQCNFHCEMFFPTPNQMSKIEKILCELKLLRPATKPDWDNAGKTYSDMIQKHLLIEDCLINDAYIKKFHSIKPRIEIVIEYMEKYDCKFNKKRIEKWAVYENNKDKIIEKDYII